MNTHAAGSRRQFLARAAAAVLPGVCVVWTGCSKSPPSQPPEATLRILCGSSMAAPVQELGKQFATARQAQLEFDLGGSETLLPKILTGVPGDLFVCHDPFEDKVKAASRWTQTVVLGYLEPVVAVRPGNPRNLRALVDLAKPGLKIGLGDPRYSTCGELFVNALRERGQYDAVMKNVALQARSHAEVANGLVLGPLDAVVVWNFVIGLYPGKLEVIPTGMKYPATRVTVLGLSSSGNPALRDAFLDWCREPVVQETFRRYGYTREKE
jgi:molybdate transport system substrate-binding protein